MGHSHIAPEDWEGRAKRKGERGRRREKNPHTPAEVLEAEGDKMEDAPGQKLLHLHGLGMLRPLPHGLTAITRPPPGEDARLPLPPYRGRDAVQKWKRAWKT
jgi:hypothetical protein